jgi:hypothetical protein
VTGEGGIWVSEIGNQASYQARLFGSISGFISSTKKLIVTILPRWQCLIAFNMRDYLGSSRVDLARFDTLPEYLVNCQVALIGHGT